MKPIQKNELTEKTKARLFNTPKMLRARRHVERRGAARDTVEYINENWPTETNKNKTAIFFYLNAVAKCDFGGNIKLPEAAFAE